MSTNPTHTTPPVTGALAPRKKGGKAKWIVGGLIVAAIIGGSAKAASGGSTSSATTGGGTSASADLHDVRYKVTGTAATVDITMTSTGGGTSQQSDLTLPLTNKTGEQGLVVHLDDYEHAYISAQITDRYADGKVPTVTCAIEVDGVEVARTTSSGEYSIATCSETVK